MYLSNLSQNKGKWFIIELLIMFGQKKCRLIMEMCENALMTLQGKKKVQAQQKGKDKILQQI